ncbi:MAG: hypothetical protein WCF23_10705 [Candidatus Nitrosopolaris sp.]
MTLVSVIKIYDRYPGGKSATNTTIATKAAAVALVMKFCEIAFELGNPWTVGSAVISSIVPGKGLELQL